MTKREKYEQPQAGDIIKAKDGTEWPIDAVKELYIKSDYTIDRMSAELQLPKSKLERLARTGIHSWNQLKKEHRQTWLKTLSERFDDTLMEKQSVVQRLEELTLMEIAHRIREIEEHYSRWGDFFARDAEHEILRDGKGQAIRLQLPNSPKDLMILKGLEEVKITNAKLLSERLKILEEKANVNDTIDVASLMDGDDE